MKSIRRDEFRRLSLDDPATNAAYAADSTPVVDNSAPDVDFLDESGDYDDNYIQDTEKSPAHDAADEKSVSAVEHTSVEHIAVEHTVVNHTTVEHTAIKHTLLPNILSAMCTAPQPTTINSVMVIRLMK